MAGEISNKYLCACDQAPVTDKEFQGVPRGFWHSNPRHLVELLWGLGQVQSAVLCKASGFGPYITFSNVVD